MSKVVIVATATEITLGPMGTTAAIGQCQAAPVRVGSIVVAQVISRGRTVRPGVATIADVGAVIFIKIATADTGGDVKRAGLI